MGADHVRAGDIRQDSLSRYRVLRPVGGGLLSSNGWIVRTLWTKNESFVSNEWASASVLIRRARCAAHPHPESRKP